MGKWFNTARVNGRRLPDFGSLRVRWLFGLGAMLVALAGAWIAGQYAVESGHFEDTESARIDAVARSLSVWLDGDELARLAETNPEQGSAETPAEVVTMSDYLHQTELANHLTAPIRALRLRNAFQSAVSSRPDEVHPQAMEVMASGGDELVWREAVDYVPAMGPALFESKSVTSTAGAFLAGYRAYAPVLDSWDKPVAVAEVVTSSHPPIWMLTLKLVLWSTLALGCVFGLLKLIDRVIRKHCDTLEHLALETRRLRAGDRSQPVHVASSAREVKRVAEALEEWRNTDDPGQRWAPPAAGPQAPVVKDPDSVQRFPTRAPQGSQGPLRFDLALLVKQAVMGVRRRADIKRIEVRVLMAERLPAELQGDPQALLAALSALLENAIKFTKAGSVTLRVSRVADTYQLRFEVADTGAGVAWQAQPRLDQMITQAGEREPREVKGGLFKAAAIAGKLGGQLGFESQPGSGSRFWFTASFQAGKAVEAQLQRPVLSR